MVDGVSENNAPRLWQGFKEACFSLLCEVRACQQHRLRSEDRRASCCQHPCAGFFHTMAYWCSPKRCPTVQLRPEFPVRTPVKCTC